MHLEIITELIVYHFGDSRSLAALLLFLKQILKYKNMFIKKKFI